MDRGLKHTHLKTYPFNARLTPPMCMYSVYACFLEWWKIHQLVASPKSVWQWSADLWTKTATQAKKRTQSWHPIPECEFILLSRLVMFLYFLYHITRTCDLLWHCRLSVHPLVPLCHFMGIQRRLKPKSSFRCLTGFLIVWTSDVQQEFRKESLIWDLTEIPVTQDSV